jgi:hypothetical protein
VTSWKSRSREARHPALSGDEGSHPEWICEAKGNGRQLPAPDADIPQILWEPLIRTVTRMQRGCDLYGDWRQVLRSCICYCPCSGRLDLQAGSSLPLRLIPWRKRLFHPLPSQAPPVRADFRES